MVGPTDWRRNLQRNVCDPAAFLLAHRGRTCLCKHEIFGSFGDAARTGAVPAFRLEL